ncbi:MAG: ETC complex I subunit [Alphaproteobacteria bacterium]|nr:ETC complex I subunit [Alphaproteobacteria bacterium]
MNVRIYKPSKNVMQSGRAKTALWVLEFERDSIRRPEPLMGWTESGDTLNQVRLKFSSREEAEEYARTNGWDYTVLPDRERRIKPRNYTDNFKYVPPEASEKR